MTTKEQHISKNEDGQYEAFDHGCLIGVFPTAKEAKTASKEQAEQDKEFVENNFHSRKNQT